MKVRLTARDEDRDGPRAGVRTLEIRVNGDRRLNHDKCCGLDSSCSSTERLDIDDEDLDVGENKIEVRAADQAGNVATRTFRLLVDRSRRDRSTDTPTGEPAPETGLASTASAGRRSTATFTALLTTNYRDTILAAAGLLSYWRLGGAPGASTAVDEKTPTDNGTYTGGPVRGQPGLIQGDANTAVQFDGVDDNVACTYDGTSLRLFVNGVEEGSVTSPIALPNDTSALRLGGSDSAGRNWSGIIDEAAFYSSALTSQDNQNHYTAGNDTSPPETTITGGPSGDTASTTPTFTFSLDEVGSTFKCAVDGGAYSTCSPQRP